MAADFDGDEHLESPDSPVTGLGTWRREPPEDGIVLCLSGGGYRAMLFHVGALWRLNELGYLRKLKRVSSVSGGSITAGVVGYRWRDLRWQGDVAHNFTQVVVPPVRRLAGHTIDRGSIIGGILLPRRSISDNVVAAYRKHLFSEAKLGALPADGDGPRFVINATNLQTGSLWRFSRRYMADYRIGLMPEPKVKLAVAVAASSAFPPVLSPLRLDLEGVRIAQERRGPLCRLPFTRAAELSDGGVYDNLGLETAWKRYWTVLVSDGGGQMRAEENIAFDWARQAMRVGEVVDNQVRSLRKRQLIEGFEREPRRKGGAYWGIRSDPVDYGPPAGTLECPRAAALELAEIKTRLKRVDDALQERLINWGYGICDTAMRRWALPEGAEFPPSRFPYSRGIG